MLNSQQQEIFQNLLNALDQPQKIWLSGYLNGILQQYDYNSLNTTTLIPSLPETQKTIPDKNLIPTKNTLIAFASETGNAKRLSTQLMAICHQHKIKAKTINVSKLTPKHLQESYIVFVISTHGEGDPPENSQNFFNQLQDSVHLPTLQYVVVGLGDSSYQHFCAAALKLHDILQQKQAQPLSDTILLDVDFQLKTQDTYTYILSLLQKQYDDNPSSNPSNNTANPSNGNANDATSNHIHVKDNVQNNIIVQPDIVSVPTQGMSRLSTLTGVVQEIILLNDQHSNKQTFHIEINPSQPLEYEPGDALGVIADFPSQSQEPVRLYSISSSPLEHQDSIHITVTLATHTLENKQIGYGKCSHYLSQLKTNDPIEFYIHKNYMFKLPQNNQQDIIMIATGSGIAPFRSFLYQRLHLENSGRNWLIFGNQYSRDDFLYQLELQEHIVLNNLQSLSLAFSRDQKEKVYISDVLQQQQQELLDWLDNGAYVYICGAKSNLNSTMKNTLIQTFSSRYDEANKYKAQQDFQQLIDDERFLKDTY